MPKISMGGSSNLSSDHRFYERPPAFLLPVIAFQAADLSQSSLKILEQDGASHIRGAASYAVAR